MTILEKRLIALSALGIRIEHEAGHRWILSDPTDGFDFEKAQNDVGIHVCKVYGGINEALDKVDSVLAQTAIKSLEIYCNELIDYFDYDKTDIEDRFLNCGLE